MDRKLTGKGKDLVPYVYSCIMLPFIQRILPPVPEEVLHYYCLDRYRRAMFGGHGANNRTMSIWRGEK